MFLAVLGSHAPGFGSGDSVRQKYAGMETDDATSMAHTLWRKQDNFSGRWTSPDPYGGSMTIADPQSFNRYTYCNNDPVNQVDPLGLYPNNYHDATSRWEDVKGYFWGDGRFDTSNTRFSRGQRNIASAEYRHDSMVSQARALSAFWDAYDAHDHDGARAILDANPSIGYFSEDADPQETHKIIFDKVELLGTASAGFPEGPLGVRPANPVQSATQDEKKPNSFTLDVDSPEVDPRLVLAIRVTFHAIEAELEPSITTVSTSNATNRRWNLLTEYVGHQATQIDYGSVVFRVKIKDIEGTNNLFKVRAGGFWEQSVWIGGKINDIRYVHNEASIRLVIGSYR